MSLLWDYEWNRISPDDFALTTVFEDATALIVGKDHRLARRKQMDMADLANEEWIVRGENTRLSKSGSLAGADRR